MVFWIRLAMVQWFEGHHPFPTPIAIALSTMLFVHSPCHACNDFLLLVQHVTGFGVQTPLDSLSFPPPPFRLSISGTHHFSPFPFSGTHYVLRNNIFRRRNPTGQLYLVCKLCWIHVRHVSTVCEPCGSCDF